MTEIAWLNSTDAGPMLEFLRGKVSDRKLRLFAVACCRCLAFLLPDRRQHRVIDLLESMAEGTATTPERQEVTLEARHALPDQTPDDPAYVAHMLYRELRSSRVAAHAVAAVLRLADRALERYAQVELLRDVTGNPFRPVAVKAAWLTPTVTDLGHTIYDERAFDRMPILADALEEASCNNEDLLSHCRGPGPSWTRADGSRFTGNSDKCTLKRNGTDRTGHPCPRRSLRFGVRP